VAAAVVVLLGANHFTTSASGRGQIGTRMWRLKMDVVFRNGARRRGACRRGGSHAIEEEKKKKKTSSPNRYLGRPNWATVGLRRPNWFSSFFSVLFPFPFFLFFFRIPILFSVLL
jgi:hypothetical protein